MCQTDSTAEASNAVKDDGSVVISEEDRDSNASVSKLLGLARPEAGMLGVALVLMVAAEASGLVNPLLVATAYDDLNDPELSNTERMSNISKTMVLVLIIHFGAVFLSFLRSSIMGVAGERVVARVRTELYGAILKQEIGFFDVHKSGELISRLGSDTALLQQGASSAVPEVILGIIKTLAAVSIMFWISPKLAGVMLGFVATILLICVFFGRVLSRLSKKYQEVLGEAQTYSTEALGAMRTIQSFCAEDREERRYAIAIGKPTRCWWPLGHKDRPTTYSVGFFKAITTSTFFTILFGFGFGGMYISLWYGFKLVTDGEITLGKLTAFQSMIFIIGGGLGQTSQFVAKMLEATGAAARIFYILEREPKIPMHIEGGKTDEEKPTKPLSMEGAVSFNNVDFAYPSRPTIQVLKNFSLSIPANHTAALVGSSGAGKSTVVALLQRFYDVTGGSVTIDGYDIRELDLKWMRSHIAYVQQEPQLFGLSVRDNIKFGVDREVTEEEIIQVAKKANAHDFISQWPEAYDTLVGERGIQLSGGQKQRIAISRALLVDPRILLLDEATSALDAESEHLVQEAIENAVIGRTVIIVAHRLSTIQRAEQIVVLDDHKIVDVGSHEMLLGRCQKYQDLIKRQSLVGRMPDKGTELDCSN